ncbi:MAG TPA: TIGR04255 family protein [Candidatus Dojkabacteria bacterium]|mgnify:CR=1 FL=1|nr:TIGR04255 family protein [Candidatus Dojkabacteria bacterium]
MERKILKNKPLVEAIFELRWELQELAPGMKTDPHYRIIVGRIYDKVSNEYPFHEQLPTASMPDEIAGYVVQHRFRKGKDKWPLIQIGPGIITVNDTEGYLWEDFEKRIIKSVNTLFEAYPDPKNNLKFSSVVLRYINAIAFDFEKENILDFLKEQMKININLHMKLFQGTDVKEQPLGLDLRISFVSTKPKGAIQLRFVRGKAKESDALIWETIVQSTPEDIPKSQDEILDWVKKAHDLTYDWFFKLIEGELLRRFE